MQIPKRFGLLGLAGLILTACAQVTRTDVESGLAVENARQLLAARLNLGLDAVMFLSREPVDWPDGCLGVSLPDRVCSQAVTPGYRMILEAQGQHFKVHSDLAGREIRLAGAPGLDESLLLAWSRDGGIAGFCDGLWVYSTGDVFSGTCPGGEEQLHGRTLLTAGQLLQLYTWANQFASFQLELGDPGVADAMFIDLTFQGAGSQIAAQEDRKAIEAFAAELFTQLSAQTPGEPGAAPSAGNPPAETPEAAREHLAGLVYRTGTGLWALDYSGNAVFVSARADAVLDPPGRRAVYLEGDEVWLERIGTRVSRSLTDGQGRGACCLHWWPGGPDVILFGSWPHPGPEPNAGYLTAVGLDGQDYRIMDGESLSLGHPAPSTDGHSIAYDRLGEPWLYQWKTGPRRFDPAKFGLEGNDLRLASPAWSRDGRSLAWIAMGTIDGQWGAALAVFNLEGGTAYLTHFHAGLDGDGWPPAPMWSPDNRWLAIVEWDTNEVWLVRADGEEEHRLGKGLNPLWSPNGRWLFFTRPEDKGKGFTHWLVEIDSLSQRRIVLPEEAVGVGWLPPD